MSILFEPFESRSRFELALLPQTVNGTATGPSVELPDGDKPVQIVVQIGGADEEASIAVSFQESDSGAAWSNVAGSFVPGLAAESATAHAFQRRKRFVRCQVVVTGDAPTATLAVLVGQECKVF